MDMASFFAEFPPIGKAEWLAAVEKSLKGTKALEELVWQPEDGLAVTPWVHADDFGEPPAPFADAPLSWEVLEEVVVENDVVEANQRIIEALQGGAEGLHLRFRSQPLNTERLHGALSAVHLDYVGLHLGDESANPMPPAAVLHALGGLAKSRQVAPDALRGTIDYNPVAVQLIADWRYAAELVQLAAAQYPGFRVLHADGRGLAHLVAVDQLCELLRIGNHCLSRLRERGISPAEAAARLHFSIAVGDSYFLEMAKLRAFRLLWLHVLRAWEAPPQYPYLSVSFEPAAYADDLYANMIRATTMAMSAVLGGADALSVLPYDHGREQLAEYSRAFSRRIARNVQHLLKMESRLDEALDPMAGSYYLEHLTATLAERAWERFKGLPGN